MVDSLDEEVSMGSVDARRVVVITGATSGIGLATATALCRAGDRVIGLGRSPERARAAEAVVRRQVPEADLTVDVADLASQRQVNELAGRILTDAPRVDVLINNAAVVPGWYLATEDGYEMQFAVNHLAPFLLTARLYPALRAAPDGRVVTVSSGSHRGARIRWADVMLRRSYHPLRAYRQSKVANVLFSYELNRRRRGDSSVRAFVADPGLVDTALGSKQTNGVARWVWERRRRRGVAPQEGAQTVVMLSNDLSVHRSTEIYWRDGRPQSPSRYAQRADEAARLWELSERLCGVRFDVG
jgi:NAD(P)-dependent dehydrogenase (short-subunit alcohol dehydrogenase family)